MCVCVWWRGGEERKPLVCGLTKSVFYFGQMGKCEKKKFFLGPSVTGSLCAKAWKILETLDSENVTSKRNTHQIHHIRLQPSVNRQNQVTGKRKKKKITLNFFFFASSWQK